MTNTNDARRRDPLEAGATSRVTPPAGRHAAHAGSNVAQSAGATSANRAVSPQATGALPAMNKLAPGHAGRGHHAPAQPAIRSDLSAALPSLSLEDAQQSQPMGAPVITFDHVTKVYQAQPNKPSLHDISLQIYAGEFVFLVGHSGSGKSTFIKLITRELKPSSGHIYVADEDLTTMRDWRVPYLRRNIGCVFQDFKLLPNKTVFENVSFALEVIGKSRHVIKTQVPEVLRLVGLQDKLNKRPDQLSGGEQQRVSIARAIVNRPPLLVCDEPTGNLDPQTSRGIMDLLERINRTGTTVLVATHDREMVDNMRRRVIALDNGQLTRDQDRGVYGFDV
ncbi:cell division ATP-binding protein FtsE [Slackia isoflavoniconvertens]|uniref:cell division ATP-binding protein FtsE n=1 Tax=Slackia isoflavoniconvertens TaxID=572010 RepID=UPI003F9B39B5